MLEAVRVIQYDIGSLLVHNNDITEAFFVFHQSKCLRYLVLDLFLGADVEVDVVDSLE